MTTFNKRFHHDIVIKASDNGGYVVTVGCAMLVFGGGKDGIVMLLDRLDNYLSDPEGMEKKYNNETGQTPMGWQPNIHFNATEPITGFSIGGTEDNNER